jgi:DNA-3-methyladenine glycosylase II
MLLNPARNVPEEGDESTMYVSGETAGLDARLKLRVVTPYRLDLTVNALRRVKANVVDVVLPDQRYFRALSGPHGVDVLEMRQVRPDELDVRVIGAGGRARLETVRRMLGTDVDLERWYRRADEFPWLGGLARRLRGLKPPRYPELWEALCHGIVFQQLSIVAGAAIMKRLVERFSTPVYHEGVRLCPFPRPSMIAAAQQRTLRSLGLSRMKASYLQEAARAVIEGAIDEASIQALSTPEAAARLMELRGIGPWSASVVLLRGLGRLDAFPLRDTGVAASIALLSGDPSTRADVVLERLGDMRGMLYFHLLVGRMWERMQDPGRPAA